MIVAIVISIIFFVIGLVIMVCANLLYWKAWISAVAVTITLLSSIIMVSLALYYNSIIKQNRSKEYPASEYDFKIKVVEFEEQKDTILVVTPKDKLNDTRRKTTTD